ncbi:hypothetical protein [Paracoccus litorisediminis]|uniref:Anti-sigma factor NepR domain-containing protein n=1 Tax=Paracoccus litorisediminis TaxID=2006130 RepID=A0A844HPX1_9RHOB|nr:hypothetical protein [Paracoccus litorisediminis]MTH62443.1 hypothetical protein [Paracoccus litorisediminis]
MEGEMVGLRMAGKDDTPRLEPELDKALSELLEQTRKEPLSPRLMELAERLSRALADARR